LFQNVAAEGCAIETTDPFGGSNPQVSQRILTETTNIVVDKTVLGRVVFEWEFLSRGDGWSRNQQKGKNQPEDRPVER
jgi:hypothetical protein